MNTLARGCPGPIDGCAMFRSAHRPLGLMMALLLILTGQGVAVARGTSMVPGQIVICSGGGPVMIDLDANGQPVGPPHFCPENALVLLSAVTLAPAPQPVPERMMRRVKPVSLALSLLSGHARLTSARDPPKTV